MLLRLGERPPLSNELALSSGHADWFASSRRLSRSVDGGRSAYFWACIGQGIGTMNDVIDNDTGEAHEIVPAEMSGAIAAEISQQVATTKKYSQRSDKVISTEIMSQLRLTRIPRRSSSIRCHGPARISRTKVSFCGDRFRQLRQSSGRSPVRRTGYQRSAALCDYHRRCLIDMQMNNGRSILSGAASRARRDVRRRYDEHRVLGSRGHRAP